MNKHSFLQGAGEPKNYLLHYKIIACIHTPL